MMSERGAQIPVRLGREVEARASCPPRARRRSRVSSLPTGTDGCGRLGSSSSSSSSAASAAASSPSSFSILLLERRALGLGALARLAGGGAADLLGQAVLLRLQRLRFVLEVAHARVGGDDAVQVDGGAQALRRPRGPRRASLAAGECRSRPGSVQGRPRARHPGSVGELFRRGTPGTAEIRVYVLAHGATAKGRYQEALRDRHSGDSAAARASTSSTAR